MTGALVAGLLAGFGVALPVGAIATYLVGLTARTSLRVGASAAVGVATADGLYALLAVVGGGSLAAALRPVADPLHIASAAVLLCVAVLGAVRGIRHYRSQVAGSPRLAAMPGSARAYLSLLGITMLNPTTVVYFAALVIGNRSAIASSAPSKVVFVLAAFAASASWQLTLAGGGAVLGRFITGQRGRLITALTSSVIVAALAVAVVVS